MADPAVEEALRMAVGPPGWTPSPALTATCSACGHAGADRAGVADLAVTWLVPDASGGVRASRFCRGCAPGGPVGGVECAGCGDGPLLIGDLVAAGDLTTAAAVDAWLADTGWRPAGPWCPECARGLRPTRAARPTSRRAGG